MAVRELQLDELADYLKGLGLPLERIDWTRPLNVSAQLLASATKENFDRGIDPDGRPWAPLAHTRPRGDSIPLRKDGLLMASASARGAKGHIEELGHASLIFGTNLDYANLQQEGGTVRPVNARFLAIPLTVEADRCSRPRQFPRPLFVHKSRATGKLSLCESLGGRLVAHYALVSEVTIPARPFLGVTEALERQIEGVFADHVVKTLGEP